MGTTTTAQVLNAWVAWAFMPASRASLSVSVTTDSSGLRVDLTPAQLAQAGVDPGQPAVIEVRPYTKEDWERDNAGRIYDTTAEMDAAPRQVLHAA